MAKQSSVSKKSPPEKGKFDKKIKTPDLFAKKNYTYLAIGIIVLIIGFYALAQMPVNGTLTMTVAPILLVAAYLIIIPIGIMAKDKSKETKQGD